MIIYPTSSDTLCEQVQIYFSQIISIGHFEFLIYINIYVKVGSFVRTVFSLYE